MIEEWTVGESRVRRVEELASPGFMLSQMFPDFDGAVFDKFPVLRGIDVVDPDSGRMMAVIHSWVIFLGRDIILIDTGVGNAKPRDRQKFARFDMLSTDFLARLANVGVAPADVTIVINTHMHIDHCGWNTQRDANGWVPTFPNARYVFGAKEHENWKAGGSTYEAQPEGRVVVRDSIIPIVERGLAEFVHDGATVIPGITMHDAPGHTLGQMIVRLCSRSETGIFSADCMHRAMQVFEPKLGCFLCEDQAVAYETRLKLLDRCAQESSLLFPAHFGAPHAGRVRHRRNGDGYEFEPMAPLGS